MKDKNGIKYIAFAVIVLVVLALLAVAVAVGVANSDAEPDTLEDVTTTATTTLSEKSEVVEVTTTTEVTTQATTTEVTTATTTEATTVTTTEATTITTTEATTVTTTQATTTATTVKEPEYGDAGVVVINEVCASNKNSLADYEGDNPDWAELYNPSKKTVNLKGYGISDDPEQPFKWTLPDTEIEAGGYLIIFCSDKDICTSGELHTNFKLSAGDETVYLTAPSGKLQDSVWAGAAEKDYTYARYPDGSKEFKRISATPGKSNKTTTDIDDSVLAPTFSQSSGFYAKQFSLKITAEEGTTIYYTTDGSVPTTSSEKYSSSITVKDRSNSKSVYSYKTGLTVSGGDTFPTREFEKATIIRAIAVDKNGKVSEVTTATYFVSEDIAKKYSDLRVISVVIDPDDLFDYETGIYVAGKVYDDWRAENRSTTPDGSTPANYNQRGSDWERDAHIDFFDKTTLEFSENVGVRIHGGWSRNNSQKSLRFYFRSKYGNSSLKYKLFEDNYAANNGKIIKTYKRFMIRNGGNDTYLLTFKDAWIQSLFDTTGFKFATQADEPIVCFLDGEYWGVYTLNETYDKNYIEEHFGVDSDNVVMIKNGSIEEGEDDDYALYSKMKHFIADNDMSDPDNYASACELLDMDSFCEYIAAETYIANEDWLWNNIACWRARETDDSTPYGDGKWRFMMFDVEYSQDLYGNGNNYRAEYITKLLNGDGYLSPMLASLVKNESFLNKLIVAYEDVMNIAFDPDYASAMLDEFYNTYSPYLNDHFDRFVTWQSVNGVRKNVSYWKNWTENRYNSFTSMLVKLYDLPSSKTYKLTLNTTTGGTVTVNGHYPSYSAGKNSTLTWDGVYLTGYKITLVAVPDEGYEFTGWSGSYDGTSAKITINPSKAYTLTANFKKK